MEGFPNTLSLGIRELILWNVIYDVHQGKRDLEHQAMRASRSIVMVARGKGTYNTTRPRNKQQSSSAQGKDSSMVLW